MLNVWAATGATDRTGPRRPVLVFFHGGGYAIGSGSWPLYEGANLARRGDAVVVTINHRLGPFGYLHLGELGGEPYGASANVGLMDLVAALGFVRDHVASFGGDPRNVTIFGESGGGAKVCALLAMPSARGLFHRAIVQSGPARHVRRPDEAHEATLGLLRKLGIAPDGDAIAKLREVPVAQLVDAVSNAGNMARGARMGFVPVLDGEVVNAHPVDAIRAGSAPDVPLLIGTTFDEASLRLAGDPAMRDPSKLSFDELPKRLLPFGDRAAGLLAAYRRSRPEATPIDILLAIQTDATMRMPSIKLAERAVQSARQAPTYMFLYCYAMGLLRAGHGFELPFVFDNVHAPLLRPSAKRQTLADRMSEAWLAFARGGDPNHAGLPHWPTYDMGKRSTMLFDGDTCTVAEDPWGAERQAWR